MLGLGQWRYIKTKLSRTFKVAYTIHTLLILPKGLFRINLQYEYKIMTKTTEYKNNDLKLLLIIITNNVTIYCSCMLRRRDPISSLILPLHTF